MGVFVCFPLPVFISHLSFQRTVAYIRIWYGLLRAVSPRRCESPHGEMSARMSSLYLKHHLIKQHADGVHAQIAFDCYLNRRAGSRGVGLRHSNRGHCYDSNN